MLKDYCLCSMTASATPTECCHWLEFIRFCWCLHYTGWFKNWAVKFFVCRFRTQHNAFCGKLYRLCSNTMVSVTRATAWVL